MDKKEILLVNKLVFDFVVNLKDEDLKLLLDGEKKISLLDNEKKIKSNKVDNVDDKLQESINKIYSCSNKEEVIKYLNKLTVVELKKISKLENIYIKSRNTKSEIIDRIVEGTIGAKIKIGILQS